LDWVEYGHRNFLERHPQYYCHRVLVYIPYWSESKTQMDGTQAKLGNRRAVEKKICQSKVQATKMREAQN
jgi:hypothetical protein